MWGFRLKNKVMHIQNIFLTQEQLDVLPELYHSDMDEMERIEFFRNFALVLKTRIIYRIQQHFGEADTIIHYQQDDAAIPPSHSRCDTGYHLYHTKQLGMLSQVACEQNAIDFGDVFSRASVPGQPIYIVLPLWNMTLDHEKCRFEFVCYLEKKQNSFFS